LVDQYSNDSFLVNNGLNCSNPVFCVNLEPGQGKLISGPGWGDISTRFIDSLQIAAGGSYELAASSYKDSYGVHYFDVQNYEDTPLFARLWLNHDTLLNMGSATMYYIDDRITQQRVAVTGKLPGTNDVPFSVEVPAWGRKRFKVD